MREVVFVDFARTAFTNRGGSLRRFSGAELAIECVKGLIKKSAILEKAGPNGINSVFAGAAFRDKKTFFAFNHFYVMYHSCFF